MNQKLGIYIHIPFCAGKCDYCDFYSKAGCTDRMDAYQKALTAHLREAAVQAKEYEVDSVYFGGGTPSFYGGKRIRELLEVLQKEYRVTEDAEITVECNPESTRLDDLRLLSQSGVSRISLGMQSTEDRELAAVHRLHTQKQTEDAIRAIRRAGIENLSLDLIYGLPGQDMNSWKRTLERTAALEPEHISCYGLKVEEGTPLAVRVENGEQLPDDDIQADMYLEAIAQLERAGYRQYEISNFAKPGRESRHNMKYWIGREYMGFGPGAHSDFDGSRYSFVRDMEKYISGVLEGGNILEESELISKQERASEYLMLGMRIVRGIEAQEYREKFAMEFESIEAKLTQFAEEGWAVRENGRWRFTPQGFLISNELIGQILDCQQA